MRDTVRLGRIAGIRVGVNWSLLAIVVLLASGLANNRFPFDAPGYASGAYALAGGVTAVALLVGVLAHEMGHALLARRVGLGVDGITLSWMGGVTRIEGDARTPGAELAIAGIGPFVSLSVGGLMWVGHIAAVHTGAGALLVSALGWLAVINVVLAVFNLLPAAPLDGGRVLHAVVWRATHDRLRATRVASRAGVVLGGVLVLAGLVELFGARDALNGIFLGFIGWWLLASARAEEQVSVAQQALSGVRVADVMRPVGAAPGWLTIRTFAEQYATGHPGWVWLLERWGAPGYDGILLGDALSTVPLPHWDLLRPRDIALPLSATMGAQPDEEALTVLGRIGGHRVVLVVDHGHTVGAVLPSDIEALLRHGRRAPHRAEAPTEATSH